MDGLREQPQRSKKRTASYAEFAKGSSDSDERQGPPEAKTRIEVGHGTTTIDTTYSLLDSDDDDSPLSSPPDSPVWPTINGTAKEDEDEDDSEDDAMDIDFFEEDTDDDVEENQDHDEVDDGDYGDDQDDASSSDKDFKAAKNQAVGPDFESEKSFVRCPRRSSRKKDKNALDDEDAIATPMPRPDPTQGYMGQGEDNWMLDLATHVGLLSYKEHKERWQAEAKSDLKLLDYLRKRRYDPALIAAAINQMKGPEWTFVAAAERELEERVKTAQATKSSPSVNQL